MVVCYEEKDQHNVHWWSEHIGRRGRDTNRCPVQAWNSGFYLVWGVPWMVRPPHQFHAVIRLMALTGDSAARRTFSQCGLKSTPSMGDIRDTCHSQIYRKIREAGGESDSGRLVVVFPRVSASCCELRRNEMGPDDNHQPQQHLCRDPYWSSDLVNQ